MRSLVATLRNLTLRKVEAFKVAIGEGSGRAEKRERLDAAGDAGLRSICAVSRARSQRLRPHDIPGLNRLDEYF